MTLSSFSPFGRSEAALSLERTRSVVLYLCSGSPHLFLTRNLPLLSVIPRPSLLEVKGVVSVEENILSLAFRCRGLSFPVPGHSSISSFPC